MLGATLTVAGIGWFLRRPRGWKLTIMIIGAQVIGDVVNSLRGDLLRGGIGVIVAVAMLLLLSQRKTRAAFA